MSDQNFGAVAEGEFIATANTSEGGEDFTIRDARLHTFEQSGDSGIAVGFQETEMKLFCKKGSQRAKDLVRLFGEDGSKWAGQRVNIYKGRGQYGEQIFVRPAQSAPPAETEVSFD